MYQGPLPVAGRLPVRPRRRAGSYQGIGRGHHPPLAWLPPLARAHHSPPTQFALEKCSPPNSLVNNNNRNCSKYNNDRATNNNTEKVNANAAVYHKTRRLGRSPCVIRNSTSPQPTIDTDSISLPDIIGNYYVFTLHILLARLKILVMLWCIIYQHIC